jgi:hypothetical protein
MQLNSNNECAGKGEASEKRMSICYPFAIELFMRSATFLVNAEYGGNETYSRDRIPVPIFGSHGGTKKRQSDGQTSNYVNSF